MYHLVRDMHVHLEYNNTCLVVFDIFHYIDQIKVKFVSWFEESKRKKARRNLNMNC
jgi:hypothetical protein